MPICLHDFGSVGRFGRCGRRSHVVLRELVAVKVGRIGVVNPLGGEIQRHGK
ncbi:MAG: hypothetical protein WBE26_08405 [Phycisphaerae bacterium]